MPTIPDYDVPVGSAPGSFQFWDCAEGIGGPQVNMADDGSRIDRFIQITAGYVGKARRVFVGYSHLVYGFSATQPYIRRVPPHGYEDPQYFDGTGTGQYPGGKPWLFAKSLERSDSLNVSSTDAVSGAPRGLLDRAHVVYVHRDYDVLRDDDPSLIFQPQPSRAETVTHPEVSPQSNPLALVPDEATLNRYVTRRYKAHNRVVTLPRAIPKWILEPGDTNYNATTPVAGPPVFEGFGKSENGLEVEITWWSVPDKRSVVNSNRPEPCVGMRTLGLAQNTVNRYLFDGVFEPYTLLFLSHDIREKRDVRGRRCYDLTYRFRYLPKYDRANPPIARGHNAILRAIPRTSTTEGTWLDYRYPSLTGKKTGDKGYRTFDFAHLFRPEPDGGLQNP